MTVSIDRLSRALGRAGHEVFVVVPKYDRKAEDAPGVIRVNTLLAFGRERNFRLANLFQFSAIRAVYRFRPDVIHVHHPFWLGSLGLFLGRRLGVPVVYTYHTRLEQYAHYVPLPSPIFRNFISHFIVKRFCNACSGVIVPTFSVEEYLRTIGVRTPILVQPTGIEYDQFQKTDQATIEEIRQRLNITSGEKVLVSVSRLGKEKNIDFLIDGALKVKALTPSDFKLLILGAGEEEARLRARIDALGLQGQVILVGQVPPDQMPHYYQIADLFVFASKSETQGMVILEAMSVGLPVVAVRSSGIDDVIEQGVFGYKTPEDLEAWAQRVVTLLDDDGLRLKFGRKAKRFAHQHDV
ncbi:MAG: glycosyltransferase, partial [Natronospirillum sp.]